ncbi:Hypothetical_protein [Hexamita inflata]|uniref:Hypothetical_protein n=1 Tax=Hexamita inflata TaxID=28002 RepID=A0ABP1GU97_9EUKA
MNQPSGYQPIIDIPELYRSDQLIGLQEQDKQIELMALNQKKKETERFLSTSSVKQRQIAQVERISKPVSVHNPRNSPIIAALNNSLAASKEIPDYYKQYKPHTLKLKPRYKEKTSFQNATEQFQQEINPQLMSEITEDQFDEIERQAKLLYKQFQPKQPNSQQAQADLQQVLKKLKRFHEEELEDHLCEQQIIQQEKLKQVQEDQEKSKQVWDEFNLVDKLKVMTREFNSDLIKMDYFAKTNPELLKQIKLLQINNEQIELHNKKLEEKINGNNVKLKEYQSKEVFYSQEKIISLTKDNEEYTNIQKQMTQLVQNQPHLKEFIEYIQGQLNFEQEQKISELFRKQLMKWKVTLDVTLKALESERILIVRNNKNALNKLYSLDYRQMQEESSD